MAILKPKKGTGKPRAQMQMLQGGPYNGQTIPLCSPGTITFKVQGWKGYYNSDNQWVDVN